MEPGNHIVSVIFQGDTYYEVQSNISQFTVYKLETPITVNATNTTLGGNVIINVTLNENATNYVKIPIAGQNFTAEVIGGFAQFNISGLAVGTYENIPIIYPGDYHFNSTTAYVTFRVDPLSVYDIDVKADAAEYGKNATVRVLIPSATGNVTIYVDGVNRGTVNLTNGAAELNNISGLSGGVHIVNVTYQGDSNHNPYYKNGTELMVNSTDNWNMRITGDYKPYGENSTFTITVDKDLLGKNLTITIDDVPYVVNFTGHTATLTLNNLSAGRHEGVVSYAGDANYAAKSSKFFPTIPKATPTIVLTQDGKDVIATVSGNSTGNVTFAIGGNEYTVNLTASRTATLEGKLDYGTNVVTAIYNGDSNYNPVEKRETFDVPTLPSLVNVYMAILLKYLFRLELAKPDL